MEESLKPNPQQLKVRLLDDNHDGEDYWVFDPSETVEIGRASAGQVQLRHPQVSKLHARVSHEASGWCLKSVGRNGVFLQEEAISELRLKGGTVLRLSSGGPRLHFQVVDVKPQSADEPHQEAVAWIEGLANGDADAASNLWEEYFDRVVKLAKSRISGRQRRVSDEEDVAVSVFESICAGMQAGKFPDLKDRESLWRLLCVMTKRKVIRHAKHEFRQKRGGGQIRGESVFGGASGDSAAFGLDAFGGDPGDQFGERLVEQTEWLFETLGDDELRRITELKLAQYTNEEIATELGCHVRTVKRRLQAIRSILNEAMSQ